MNIPANFVITDTDTSAQVAEGTADATWVQFTYSDGGANSEATAMLRPQFEALWAALPQFRHMTIQAA